MLLIAICDDEPVFCQELHNALQKYYVQNRLDFNIKHFNSGKELLLSEFKFDVIFLDYQMPNIDGIETARLLRIRKKECAIIFLTNYPKIVFQSFEVNTFRFLVKPINEDELFKALDDYRNSIDDTKYLLINTHNGLWKSKYSDIIYLQAEEKHTIIRTKDEFFECILNLGKVEKLLPDDSFFRSHRAYIINFKYIKNHTLDEILFENSEKAKIGSSYRKEFKEAFQQFIVDHNQRERK